MVLPVSLSQASPWNISANFNPCSHSVEHIWHRDTGKLAGLGRDTTLNIVISTFLPSLSSQIVLEYFGYTLLMHDSNLKEGILDLNIYSRL